MQRSLCIVFSVFMVVLTITAMTGCGSNDFGTVTGTITIDGQPAPAGLEVTFKPQSTGGSPSYGVTDASGKYEMIFSFSRKGVMVGPCYVRFGIANPANDDAPPPPKIKLTTSMKEGNDITFDVKPGRQTFNYDIKLSGE